MGHGAPKRVDAIPTETVVQIYAWEGLLFDAMEKMTVALKGVFSGDESLWDELDRQRKAVVFYNQQYTKSILSLQISQSKG